MKKQILALINDDKVFIPIAEEAFNAVDTDKSGFIDKDEFKEGLQRKLKEIKEESIKDRIKSLEKDFV